MYKLYFRAIAVAPGTEKVTGYHGDFQPDLSHPHWLPFRRPTRLRTVAPHRRFNCLRFRRLLSLRVASLAVAWHGRASRYTSFAQGAERFKKERIMPR